MRWKSNQDTNDNFEKNYVLPMYIVPLVPTPPQLRPKYGFYNYGNFF